MYKKIIASFLIVSLLGIQPALCFTLKDVYEVEHATKQEVIKNIDEYITYKKHKVHRKDLENGYFYIRPRYMGNLLGEKDYVALKVDEYKGDTLLFIRNDFSSNRIHQLIVKNLKKSGYKCIDIDDGHLEEPYSEDVSNFIAGYNNTNTVFTSFKEVDTADFNYSTDENLADKIEIKVYKNTFTSNLDEKYAGYTFNITNKNEFPIVITGVQTFNTLDDKEAFKKVKKVTWQNITISFLAGLFAFPTFGISLAALPLAASFDIKENLPAKNESEKFLQEQAATNRLMPYQSADIRVIATKSDSIVNKRPYIKINFSIPDSQELFTVDTRNGKGDKQWEEML